MAKWRGKISTICKWSFRVSCGNAYLCDFARRFNQSVILNPTTIDTLTRHTPEPASNRIVRSDNVVVGWTGSHSTLKYFEQLEPVLQTLENRFPGVSFVVIANRAPSVKLKRLHFIQWRESTEIEDLKSMDIGLMPLPDDPWSQGKCGFKILQYMSLEIPSVSSPVGVNTSIVTHGYNGFLANSEHEWIELLEKLIIDPALRREVGARGRDTVVTRYSVTSNTSTFLALFE